MLKGVLSVTPGYAGGTVPNSTYEQIAGGSTGHAEVIRIEYDSAVIRFRDLLAVFFATHDSTTKNRQGNDVGTQYRSAIFYTTAGQKTVSEDFVKEINASHAEGDTVVTEVTPLQNFYEAEDYHKDYFTKNKGNPYCEIVINPKLEKVKQKFAELLRDTPNR